MSILQYLTIKTKFIYKNHLKQTYTNFHKLICISLGFKKIAFFEAIRFGSLIIYSNEIIG
jgi:hypothetical protein